MVFPLRSKTILVIKNVMKIEMNINPIDKSDEASAQRLLLAGDEEVLTILPDLLEWLKDYNWPVTSQVHERLKRLGQPLVKPLKEILQGNDGTWKWFIISCFLPDLDKVIAEQLHDELHRIINNPTKSDVIEEVVLEAQEYFDELS